MIKLTSLKTAGILFLFVLPLMVLAQPAAELNMYKLRYQGKKTICLNLREDVTITVDKGRLHISSDVYEEMFYLDDNAQLFSKESLGFSGFYSIEDLEASTLVPGSKKYSEIKVKNFSTHDDLGGDAFHDDYKKIEFYFPSLGAGTKTKMHYKRVHREPRFMNAFFFASVYPVEKAVYSITYPDGVELDYRFFGIDEKDLEKTETPGKGTTTVTWTATQMSEIEFEESAPAPRNYIPHIVPRVASYTVDGQKKRLLGNVGDLYNWYYSLIDGVNKEEDERLQSLVDSLTVGKTTEIEKVKSIYYWVQDHIKYVAFEDGLGGFVPRRATVVCERRYGDCKDMSSITNRMLDLAGIRSYMTWIGTRDIPYSYSDVPTPSADNHMIVTYENNGNYYFLDATGKNNPFGYPTPFIQGKEALLAISPTEYKVVKVPVISSDKNSYVDSAFVKMEGNKMVGKGTTHYSGYYHMVMAERLSGMTKEGKLKFLRAYYEKGSNKFQIENPVEKNLENKDEPMVLQYDFNIDDYIRGYGEEVYINLNLDKPFIDHKMKETRKQDYERRFKSTQKYTTVLEIPKDYKSTYVPESSSFDNENFGYRLTYSKEGQILKQDLEIYINELTLTKAEFEDWNTMITNLNKAYNEVIILKKQL